MNFWSLDQKIWEGFTQTDRQTNRQTTSNRLLHSHRRKLFVGDKKVLMTKKTIFLIFLPYSSILGPKNIPSSYKGGLFWQVRMDMVLGNLHAKFGAHSSSSFVIIAAQTEICQKVAFFFVIFWQFFEDFSYFPLSQSNKTLKPSNRSPGE